MSAKTDRKLRAKKLLLELDVMKSFEAPKEEQGEGKPPFRVLVHNELYKTIDGEEVLKSDPEVLKSMIKVPPGIAIYEVVQFNITEKDSKKVSTYFRIIKPYKAE